MSKTFERNKSNVSAELKAQFQINSTRATKVNAVPGIGKLTAEKLAEKGILTVGDLVDTIACFEDLTKLVSGVNRHRIFDCLDCYLQEKCAEEYEDTAKLSRAMEAIALVDATKDKETADQVGRCQIS